MPAANGLALFLDRETAESLVSGQFALTFAAPPLYNLTAGSKIYFTVSLADDEGCMHLIGCAEVDKVDIFKKSDFNDKGELHGLTRNYMAHRFDENWQRRRLYAIY